MLLTPIHRFSCTHHATSITLRQAFRESRAMVQSQTNVHFERFRNKCQVASDLAFGPLINYASRYLSSRVGVPDHFVALLLATEDKRFLAHPGIDLFAIARAGLCNCFSSDSFEGASTIPQQLFDARIQAAGGGRPRTWRRKASQSRWAIQASLTRSKVSLFSEYLSIVYWGVSYYGLVQASKGYFSVSPPDLGPEQSFFLAERLASPNIVYLDRVTTLMNRPFIVETLSATGFSIETLVEIYQQHFDCGDKLWLDLAKGYTKSAAHIYSRSTAALPR